MALQVGEGDPNGKGLATHVPFRPQRVELGKKPFRSSVVSKRCVVDGARPASRAKSDKRVPSSRVASASKQHQGAIPD